MIHPIGEMRRRRGCPQAEALEPRLVLSIPKPDHVVIVIEENRPLSAILNSPDAPYINSLIDTGALFTESYGVTHPSLDNYLALFSGNEYGMGDTCKGGFYDPNLYTALADADLSLAGYFEDLPSPGFSGCGWEHYSKTHNPVAFFDNVPDEASLPLASYFPDDYRDLPTVSFVVPNLFNDMHDGSTFDGDEWLRVNIDPYVKWAQSNNSLLILTWDEGAHDPGNDNHIATVFVGPMVQPGEYSEPINHYNVLRTVEDMYGLAYLGSSGDVSPITDVWTGGAGPQSPGTGLFTSVPPTIPPRSPFEPSLSLVAVEESAYGIPFRTDNSRSSKEAVTQLFGDRAPASQTVAGAAVLQDTTDINESATGQFSDNTDLVLEHQQLNRRRH